MDKQADATGAATAPTNEKAPRVLTIDRSKWRRGGDAPELRAQFGFTYLRNEEGFMCCLGFDAIACGVKPDEINGYGEPCEIEGAPPEYSRSRRGDAIKAAINANDASDIPDHERETRVRTALLSLGWDDVVFIDGAEGR